MLPNGSEADIPECFRLARHPSLEAPGLTEENSIIVLKHKSF